MLVKNQGGSDSGNEDAGNSPPRQPDSDDNAPSNNEAVSSFATILDAAKNKSVIIAIDFGTAGTGFSYSFKTKPPVDPTDIFPNPAFPETHGGKTNTAVLLNRNTLKLERFGREALTKAKNLKPIDRADYLFFNQFKMSLYETKAPLSRDTKIPDEFHQELVPVRSVIAASLQYVKEVALKECKQDASQALFVVTVPAIWRDAAKQLTHAAAEEAGLIQPDGSGLLLALEPVAASIWCMHTSRLNLAVGDTYILADCGGGTIDVTVHEIISDDASKLRLKEAVPISGGDWGSTAIDRAFKELIKEIFGEKRWANLVANALDASTLRMNWEEAKCAFNGSEDATISLPKSLLMASSPEDRTAPELVDLYNQANGADLELEDNNLILPHESILKLFAGPVGTIVSHIRSLINKLRSSPTNPTTPKHIIVVGNFANSRVLQQQLRDAFEPDILVVVPTDPGMAVVKGAVMWAAGGTKEAPIQASRMAYGVKTTRPSEYDDPEELIEEIDHVQQTRNAFDVFVEQGQSVEPGYIVKRTLYPLRADQMAVNFEIYGANKAGIKFTNDRACKKIGNIRVTGAPDELVKGICISMMFGSSELRVEAQSKNGQPQDVVLDFLS